MVADLQAVIAENYKTSFVSYDLTKAKRLGSNITHLFRPSTLDEAIRAAGDYQMEKGEFGRVHLFIPCNTESLTPGIFEELLDNPSAYPLQAGEKIEGNSIYGTRNDAFMGKTVSGREHSGFLVYDSAVAVVVDLINRDGRSVITPAVKEQYTSSLEAELGYPIRWNERPLADL